MKLYNVIIYLTLTLKHKGGRVSKKTDYRRLVLTADDEAHARALALSWLAEKTANAALAAIEFGTGRSEASEIHLDRTRDDRDPIQVHEEPSGLVEIR